MSQLWWGEPSPPSAAGSRISGRRRIRFQGSGILPRRPQLFPRRRLYSFGKKWNLNTSNPSASRRSVPAPDVGPVLPPRLHRPARDDHLGAAPALPPANPRAGLPAHRFDRPPADFDAPVLLAQSSADLSSSSPVLCGLAPNTSSGVAGGNTLKKLFVDGVWNVKGVEVNDAGFRFA